MPRGVKPKDENRNEVMFQNHRMTEGYIKKHMATGAYVEVLTALERLISSRLSSYLVKFTEEDMQKYATYQPSFSTLIKLWRKWQPQPIKAKKHGIDNLQDAVDKWRDKRNAGTHDGLNSIGGKPPLPFEEQNRLNREACEEGIIIKKAVVNWLDKVKYDLEKRQGKTLENPRHK